jgi:hypothetical protein
MGCQVLQIMPVDDWSAIYTDVERATCANLEDDPPLVTRPLACWAYVEEEDDRCSSWACRSSR